jgi:hypothetical protein
MNEDELLLKVQEMRERGNTPKVIAKALGLRPSEVAPLVRKIASLQTPADPADRAIVGCWVNQGWNGGLGVGENPDWDMTHLGAENPLGTEGIAQIMVARQDRASRIAVCGYLVDVYCLGLKNTTGPLHMGVDSLDDYRHIFFSPFLVPPLAIPLDLAQNLVHGAIAYARSLGFEPYADFTDTASYLGTPSVSTPIQFGRKGRPFYMAGPNDNPRAVIRTLDASVGAGNYFSASHII